MMTLSKRDSSKILRFDSKEVRALDAPILMSQKTENLKIPPGRGNKGRKGNKTKPESYCAVRGWQATSPLLRPVALLF